MSELSEKRWAVISHRGVEASEISYPDAVMLIRSLANQKVYGLCLVTAAAAERDRGLGRSPEAKKPPRVGSS